METKKVKEIQSVDSLTQKEINIYNKAKELREGISLDKTKSMVFGVMSIGELTYAALGMYAAQVQSAPATESPYMIALGAAVGIFGTIAYGLFKQAQGHKEQELYDIVNKREYKKAEKIMSQK
ncbi:MAG: hypothetical protein WC758_04300 [Candidatus Woesearchaeota archaeon]|jgi:hypothetical protein